VKAGSGAPCSICAAGACGAVQAALEPPLSQAVSETPALAITVVMARRRERFRGRMGSFGMPGPQAVMQAALMTPTAREIAAR